MTIVTNAQYAQNVKVFKKACEIAGIAPTPRQAAKFQSYKGKAFLYKEEAIKAIKAMKRKA